MFVRMATGCQTNAGLPSLASGTICTETEITPNWPDPTRNRSTALWHYVNLPRGSDCAYVRARDCPDGSCVVEVLNAQVPRLTSQTSSPQDRLEALKYVVHLVQRHEISAERIESAGAARPRQLRTQGRVASINQEPSPPTVQQRMGHRPLMRDRDYLHRNRDHPKPH